MFRFAVRAACAFLCALTLATSTEAAQKPAYFQAITLADGAQLVIRLQDPDLIKQARDIVSGKERTRLHFSANIVKAPAVYNPGWGFHLDPNSVEFFETAIEVCDATTVMVEQNLEDVGDDFLPQGRWCPWSSRLVGELNSPTEPVLTVVSSASLSEVANSPASLASILGEDLTNSTESATTGDLPTKLAGVEVEFRRENSSIRRKAPLLMASPERISFVVPSELSSGLYAVRLIRDGERDLETATRIESVAPAIFFVEARDGRYAAASLLRIRADGSRSDESVLSTDSEGNFEILPIDFGSPEDRLYLSLYGSGIGQENISVRVESDNVPVLYSGPQGSLPGLDQINIELPRSLASESETGIVVQAENDAGQRMDSIPVKLAIRPQ